VIKEFRYGKRVREERKRRGWTQEHLATVAGIAPRTVARIEKDEVQGLESLMAIAGAFGVEIKDMSQTVQIAESKPLRSLMVRRAEDLRVCLNRAHDSGLHRTLILPMRRDIEERVEELTEAIFSDIQYMSPDETDILNSWIASVRDSVEELQARGFAIFTIQDCREGFIGEPGRKKFIENWTTGYYLVILEHSCFSVGGAIHRFSEACGDGVVALHGWLRQEQDGTELILRLFANELMINSAETASVEFCQACFPNGPTGECLTEDYLQKITGISKQQIESLLHSLSERKPHLVRPEQRLRMRSCTPS